MSNPLKIIRKLEAAMAVLRIAKSIREGRYSIRRHLDKQDRELFDRFNEAVDALYEEPCLDLATSAALTE